MDISFLFLLIVLFFSTFIGFGIFIILNVVLENKTVKKWRMNGKKESTVILKNLFVKGIEILICLIVSLLLIYLPSLNLITQIVPSGDNVIKLVSMFYIPLLFAIGMVFNGWTSILVSLPLSVMMVIGYSTVYAKDYDFFPAIIFQILCLVVLNISVAITRMIGKNNSFSYIIMSSILVFIILYLLDIIIFSYSPTYMAIMALQITVLWVVTIIITQCSQWYYQFSKKIKAIDSSKTYENKYFLNYGYAISNIKNYIKANNVNYGVVIVFNFINLNALPNLWGNNIARQIQNYVLKDVIHGLKWLDPIFFITESGEYACFINLKNFNGDIEAIYSGNNKQIRSSSDALRKIQNSMLNLSKTISYENKSQQIYTGAYASLYGVHSYDIDQLIKLCLVTKQKSFSAKRGGVILNVYNPSQINLIKPIEVLIKENVIFNPLDFQVQMHKTNYVYEDLTLYDSNVACVNKLLFNYEEIKNYALNNHEYDVTSRMIAMKVLRTYMGLKGTKNSAVIIDYPLEFVLSNAFNLGEFKAKLESLNLQPENVLLRFDLSELQNSKLNNFTNLQNIKNIGCPIIFTNATDNFGKIINQIKPNFISFNKNYAFLREEKNQIYNLFERMNIKIINSNY